MARKYLAQNRHNESQNYGALSIHLSADIEAYNYSRGFGTHARHRAAHIENFGLPLSELIAIYRKI